MDSVSIIIIYEKRAIINYDNIAADNESHLTNKLTIITQKAVINRDHSSVNYK